MLTYILIALLALAIGYGIASLRFAKDRTALSETRATLAAERRATAEAAERREAEHRREMESLRTEFRNIAADSLRQQSEDLRLRHVAQLDDLLHPLGEDIEQFRTQFLRNHAAMERYVEELIRQTTMVGREADALARALKGQNKLQGNWGEAVLKNILEVSGLTEGRDFTIQDATTDEQGRRFIPDVVVHLPGDRHVIIDSKVSLTAYADACAAEDVAERDNLLREHVQSVRRHIRELSQKDYGRKVKGSIGYVLMFIPNEAAYMAALTTEPKLSAEAYAQRVILLNPSNLLMALQLAYNLWQSEMQSRSVNEIVQSAEKLYKKFTLFATNFVQIGRSLRQLQDTYDRADKQLHTGRGNIVAQLEGWRKKGLNPASQMPAELAAEESSVTETEAENSNSANRPTNSEE